MSVEIINMLACKQVLDVIMFCMLFMGISVGAVGLGFGIGDLCLRFKLNKKGAC